MNVTNKYLKSSIVEISNFFRNNTKPPEDMYLNLILELKASHMLMPVVFDGEHVSFPHIEVDDGTKLLPLFTSKDELRMYSKDFDFLGNEIAYYIELIRDYGFDGILIDAESDEFCVDSQLLGKITIPDEGNTGKGLDGAKLRKMALKEKNRSLKRFIRKESNFNNFDGISKLLAKSLLLNVVVSEDDLTGLAKEGVISREDAHGFTLYTKKSGREHYGAIYTDVEAIAEYHDTLKYFYYAQVTNKFRVFGFILSNDFDGIIINPGTDDYYVPRQVILRLLDDDLIDTDLENATRYAFVIE